ncbi:MAG: hypothetical protein NC350_05855 [Corallococcus sp.]|nr:hypothetical protein [Corallococcus sp.]
MINKLIGLEVSEAQQLLKSSGNDNFKFVYYTDRKQKYFDKEVVVSVKSVDGIYELTVCPMQFGVVGRE